jgi:hypothetical protein
VARVCFHCGTTLQRDDARFCPHCGSFVESRSQSSGSFTPVMRPGRTRKAALREQIASQSDSHAAQHGENAELASHGKSTVDFNDEANCLPAEDASEWAEEKDSDVEEFYFSLASQAESETLVDEPDREETVLPDSTENVSSAEEVQESLQNVRDGTPVTDSHAESEEPSIEAIPTVSLPVHQEHQGPSNIPSVQERVQRLQPFLDEPARRRRSRLGLWLAIFLVVLILVGVIGWLVLSQSPNTNPWQRFTGTDLGFSVLYPTDWQVQIDHKLSIVHFSDSTQTDKVDVTVSSAAIGNVAQFLQQQVSQLGMTGVTAEPSQVFGGISWQQVRGKLSQEGVSYTVTLLAAIHGRHLYFLTQRSPQSIYNDEEGLVFSTMRAGWHFS